MEEDNTTITCFTMLKKKAPDRPNGLPLPKKKRSAFQVIKAAIYLLQNKSSKHKSKSMNLDVPSKGSWKAVLGSMRPMHLNNNVHSPPPAFQDKRITFSPEHDRPSSEELFTPPFSPFQDTATSSSYSSCGVSRYTSATNLQELQNSEESSGDESDQCARYDDNGDEMIDAKAEEFINQFYQQIRIQNLENADEDDHHTYHKE
ncbi:hypothetical protein SLEP1_g1432 [Rubroshorea leprosula]|uniref:Uncharacterized protein n=1 Tax=Rubroshorea leprosula TaxID=152421 RepID=A0AAV5HMV9_9ROSI|nr:hypothetical protein SLEP1_g1432 [Rubroshorea leprosula]